MQAERKPNTSRTQAERKPNTSRTQAEHKMGLVGERKGIDSCWLLLSDCVYCLVLVLCFPAETMLLKPETCVAGKRGLAIVLVIRCLCVVEKIFFNNSKKVAIFAISLMNK
ncbi:MAG: hypothetical protein MJZ81_04750 [Bacteroidales bacterium]|nr:hypothetical protein [Bacteroidales bacterium]